MMKLSSPVARVSIAAALLLSATLHFFRPSPVPFGPITLEEEFSRVVHGVFATERAFEQLQELMAPSVLVMRFPDPDNDPRGPIYIDVTHDKSRTLYYNCNMPSRIDASDIRDTSGVRDKILPLDPGVPIAPLPGAAPCPSCDPSSTTALLLAFTVVTFSAVAAGTLFVKRALAPKNRGLAHIVPLRVTPSTGPCFPSSSETRRSSAESRVRRSKKFRPSLPSISESPRAAVTFDSAGFLKALESLARDQQEVKSCKQEQNLSQALRTISRSDEGTIIRSNHVRALTEENATATKLGALSKPANIAQSHSRTQTAPGQLRFVPGTPTRASAAVRRIVPVSPLRLSAVAQPQLSRASTSPPLAPIAAAPPCAPLVSERSQLPASLAPGAILYQTPSLMPRGTSIIYETPAPIATSVIYSTSDRPPSPPRIPPQIPRDVSCSGHPVSSSMGVQALNLLWRFRHTIPLRGPTFSPRPQPPTTHAPASAPARLGRGRLQHEQHIAP
ncbi:hypothetical protein FB451DRAFT_40907 [Mycena latifolia]|nr:hypothetical protein FB451DRAFT_40907 [Mycena latifolia]